MSDPDIYASAHAARAAHLDALADLTPEQLDYLEHVDEIPDPTGEGVECSDSPLLTAEEWAYIKAVSGG